MKDIAERVSYLQGLSEGLNISEGSPQGKIISGMLGVLEEIADELVYMQSEFETFKEYVESIDNDLLDLEDEIFNQDYESDDVLFDDDDDSDYIEIDCSHCGEELYFDASLLDDDDVVEIICPNCNEVVFINDGSFDYEHTHIESDYEDEEIENPSPS